MEEHLSILCCPITGNELKEVPAGVIERYKASALLPGEEITRGLADSSGTYFYPIVQDILILLPQYAFFTGTGRDQRPSMSFDRKRVFDYYNQISFQEMGAYTTFSDAGKWVDFRPVTADYLHASLSRVSRFYPPEGKYFLDIASGPVGFEENLRMSDGYEYVICIDLSFPVLLQARSNLQKAGKKGLFICGDITSIPLRSGSCTTVVSQHTLYHVHKNEQKKAVEELYRVATSGGTVVIVYSWFYHSWAMNLSLHLVQLYRVLRYLAGKVYVRLFRSRPRLYYYVHSPRWFRTTFPFGNDIEFHAWQSVNKYFLNLYIHPSLGGKKILSWLQRLEERMSQLMGRLGEYPAIVIRKK